MRNNGYTSKYNFFNSRGLILYCLMIVLGVTGRGYCGEFSPLNSFGRRDRKLKRRGFNNTLPGIKIGFSGNNNRESDKPVTTGRTSLCDVIHRMDKACPSLFPCKNGHCKQKKVSTGIISLSTRRQIYCHCYPGWTGYMCHQCCSETCLNNGTCIVDSVDGRPFCRCTWGYSGANCEIKLGNISRAVEYKPDRTPTHDENAWKIYLALTGIFGVIFIIFAPTSVLYMWKRRAVILMKISQTFYKMQDKEEVSSNVNYKYDAFISYRSTSGDEQFVMQTLYPKLEKDMNFTLCLHQRDFVPGETIANNIIDAIQHSRRTILILSPSYIQSEWTRLEYQVAQHEMLKLRHRIVPIMFENICHVKHVDENLKLILNSVTYLVWPGKDSSKESLFWKTLRKALPSEKIKVDDSSGCSVSDKCQSGDRIRTDSSSTCESYVSFSGELNKDICELPVKVTSM